ncbi:MAG: aromatic ring-hydroxylating dioxygenase subunit alpha [Pseudomonadota bacterium]
MTYADQIKSVKDYIKLPFVYEHWYVAGTSEEFTEKPTAKTLLNRSIVLYRTPDGTPNAMQNRCLHRSFPLSEGFLEGDNLVCRYHGIRYTPEGQIARIPCQAQTSDKKLRTYPLKEVGPFVFIWMGDPDTVGEFPDLYHLADPNYRTVHDFMTLEGNYLLLMENLNDLTHFAYLHKETFPFDDAFMDLPTEVKMIDGRVWCERIDNTDTARSFLPPSFIQAAEGKHVERRDGGMCLTPGIFLGNAPLYIGTEDDPDRRAFNQRIAHYATPETETTSHYWWSMSLDFEQDNDMFFEVMKPHLNKGFDEDKWAIQHMQELLSNDQVDYEEMIIAGDQAGLLHRRVMLKHVQAEHGDGA